MFKKIISLFLMSFLLLVSFNFVLADDPMNKIVNSDGQLVDQHNEIINNSGLSTNSLPDIISNIIKIALGLFGTVALVFVIWSGVDWMLSKGDSKKIATARDRMIAAAIGLAIIAASYAITDFIIAQISVIAG